MHLKVIIYEWLCSPMIIIIFRQIFYNVLFELFDGINCKHNLIVFFHKPIDLNDRGLKRFKWQWKIHMKPYAKILMGANASWWFSTGKKHQELIVSDGFQKENNIRR